MKLGRRWEENYMDKCKDCIHYEEGQYNGKGYCHIYDMYVKKDDACYDFEE